ncbi:Hint domain-containing protein [Sulfitobacter mediterraneus]|uniref:Hint domain-containing protein n=1 Tax=Sulfitobacter mediterraneus TaxID=83219 RepID=UPI0019340834|nr:Hint domain-containing protein [Sulfitobacter mediterraneus]MBM1311815.1 Hint domain-containing protein [Sulfitobacter mediterraneus]MBM1315696.1 Hint domain-containing protein [Sulfitobacter mediterraneus]MBM1324058.1 Hint domain-containing protein [Sulfitobacter mediterraneus]MBM1327970.1 Hint domain-containing protein [Sulfitobacter mediterraneus]MBM1399318.1 Hint domain-containing protein [Sulfitobacter mediterraneus]
MDLYPIDHDIPHSDAVRVVGRQDRRQSGVPAGTEILTVDGALPVEFLSAGDRIVSRDAGFVTVQTVCHDHCSGAWMVIAAGAFGPGKPETDLALPSEQRLLLRGSQAGALFGEAQVLVPLSELAGQPHFASCANGPAQVFSIFCGQPQVIYAGGVELATAD